MRYVVPLLITLFFLLSTILVRSESLTVSLQVGSTQAEFSGYTSPSAFITIKEGSVTLGTTTANSSGAWTKSVNVDVPGSHTYTISTTDSSSRQAATLSYTISVAGNTTTSVSNIVIPPTTSISSTTLSGMSYPTSTITITSSTGDSFTTVADSSGNWTFSLTSLSTGGSQTIQATATVGSYLSVESTGLSYTPSTVSSSSTPTPTASATASQTPSPSLLASPSPSLTPSIARPFFFKLYDANQDGLLTRVELFDTIKKWLSRLLVCDLNHDGTCNLIDLSILLYYFER